MKRCMEDKNLNLSQNDFEKPEGFNNKIELDCSKYKEDKEQEESIEIGEDDLQ
jgi:hypothetical protein